MDLQSLEIHEIAWIVAGICSFGAVFVSTYMIYMHLKNYTEPRVQVYIVRIVLLIPIYTIDSYLSLLFKEYSMYFDLGRDCYEAYVLYMFFRLLVELADGEEKMIEQMEEMRQIRYTLPFCCFHIKPGRIFLHRCKQMILQYVMFKPLLAITSFVTQLAGYYHGSYSVTDVYLYVAIFYNVSITISLYFLVLFYEATKDILKPFKPLSKFFCIKAIIFFSFWQSVAISGMVEFGILLQASGDYTIQDVADGLQAFLICVEMFPLALIYTRTFGHQSFKDHMTGTFLSDNMSVFSNFANVANVKDVVSDTMVSLKKGPKRKIFIEDFLDIPRDVQVKRVVKQGWIGKRGEDLAKIWKTRYVVLISKPRGLVWFKANPFSERERRLIEDENGKLKARGYLDFSTATEVRNHKKTGFCIKTPARDWKFKCHTTQERDEWLNAIFGIAPSFRGGHRGSVSLEDHAIAMTPEPMTKQHIVHTTSPVELELV